MQKLIATLLFLALILTLQTQAFATTMNCKFKNSKIEDVKSIRLTDDSFIINNQLEIPLEKSRVRCGNYGKQTRLDGQALGYQVVLKTCSTDAEIAGHIIDAINELAVDIICDREIKP